MALEAILQRETGKTEKGYQPYSGEMQVYGITQVPISLSANDSNYSNSGRDSLGVYSRLAANDSTYGKQNSKKHRTITAGKYGSLVTRSRTIQALGNESKSNYESTGSSNDSSYNVAVQINSQFRDIADRMKLNFEKLWKPNEKKFQPYNTYSKKPNARYTENQKNGRIATAFSDPSKGEHSRYIPSGVSAELSQLSRGRIELYLIGTPYQDQIMHSPQAWYTLISQARQETRNVEAIRMESLMPRTLMETTRALDNKFGISQDFKIHVPKLAIGPIMGTNPTTLYQMSQGRASFGTAKK